MIVGTAGHIDHGKSTLVRALTGVDPDRLKEEKERGITIDLGFAHLDLGDGRVASFIDVPGHERFVRNMLAGAHGIDAALLVVAADESVMPQTVEHFHICRLLGIRRGIIALTKCDMADEDTQALAELEVKELVSGSFLEGAPVVRLSARTGAGLPDLVEALRVLSGDVGARTAGGLLRLPLDRVFSLRGFGTVVTGTLVSGTLAVGDDVLVMPQGTPARVRGLQVHGAAATQVGAGHRTAVNLSGVDVPDLARGQVLVRPGTLEGTQILDVLLTLLPSEKGLREQARVRVHVASAEILARVRLAEGRALVGGQSARAQLRLEQPALVGRGDRLVVRSCSPARTLGGAVVLDTAPPRRRRAAGTWNAAPAEEATLAEAVRALIGAAGPQGMPALALAARLTVPVSELGSILASDPRIVRVGQPGVFLSDQALAVLASAALSQLAAFHRENPLLGSMPRELLRARVFSRTGEGVFEHVLASLSAAAAISVQGDTVSAAGHAVRLAPAEDAARRALLTAFGAAGLIGLEQPAALLAGGGGVVAANVLKVLVAEKVLRKVGDALVLQAHLEALARDVRARWPEGAKLEVAGFKELTGLTRKHVIPLLEHLDRERVTRRVGDARVVLR